MKRHENEERHEQSLATASDPHVAAFLHYGRAEKGLSTNTILAYRRDLLKFVEFLETRQVSLIHATRTDIIDFLSSLYRRGLDSRSVARHLVTIRNFYRFGLGDDLIADDPAANIESPKIYRTLPHFLSVAEVDSLLSQPDLSTPAGLRDRAMIELMYSTGLRVSELCGVRVSDLQINAGTLRCIGKGDKERIVPVGRRALESIATYVREARPKLLRDRTSPFLFVGSRGQKDSSRPVLAIAQEVRPRSGPATVPEPAHAAPQFRDALARPGRGSSLRAVDAGPRGHFDDANLHARGGGTFKTGL